MTQVQFSVAVVDGSGREVYSEPVLACFDLVNGHRHTAVRVTGDDGRAHFSALWAHNVHAVTLSAAREQIGPFRPPIASHFVIET